jgi:hypothetical protein
VPRRAHGALGRYACLLWVCDWRCNREAGSSVGVPWCGLSRGGEHGFTLRLVKVPSRTPVPKIVGLPSALDVCDSTQAALLLDGDLDIFRRSFVAVVSCLIARASAHRRQVSGLSVHGHSGLQTSKDEVWLSADLPVVCVLEAVALWGLVLPAIWSSYYVGCLHAGGRFQASSVPPGLLGAAAGTTLPQRVPSPTCDLRTSASSAWLRIVQRTFMTRDRYWHFSSLHLAFHIACMRMLEYHRR